MTRARVLTAILLALTGALLLVSTAVADTHDEKFRYEVYSGMRPPSDPGEIILTEGWHGEQFAESALDIVVDGVTTLGAPVYASIKTVQPGSGIIAQIGDRTNGDSGEDGCRQVEVVFLKDGEEIGSITYKHVVPLASLRVGTSVPLEQRAGNLAPPMHLGGISQRLHARADESDGPGRDGAECPSGGYHLHQEASNWERFPHVYRNTPHPSDTDITLRYGFLTVGAGSDSGGRLAPREYRPFCSDTWLFLIQSSPTAPSPSLVANCEPPSEDEEPNIASVTGAAQAITVAWMEPRKAWGGACSGTAPTCVLTMDAAKTASVSFRLETYDLTVTATGGGTVSPSGTTTQDGGAELTLTASWNDATHTFTGWGGACSGTTSTCTLTMDADKTVTATFAALPADRCATTTAADCIRAVYRGAPDDYAQVADIPADKLLTPGSDGRYTVDRGQQVTVVTAARLPTGYTRFYLQRRAAQGVPPTSYMRLIPPVGTTYTFTVTTDERAPTLVSFDLRAARPRPGPFQRPGVKPELGDVVVTTEFQVAMCETGDAVPSPAANPGLVADCEALLAMRDALAGTATLNWRADAAMSGWDGVTVGGTPQRVTQLSLASRSLTGEMSGLLGELTALTQLRLNGNQLTGHIPWALTQLSGLTHLYLAGNTLTGCVPPALRTITNNDLTTLALPDCAPLVLTLTAERAQCSEATLNPVSWTVTGGTPPYTVTVDGETAAADATSVNATCGTLPEPGEGETPVTEAPGTIPGSVTDATGGARHGQRRLHDRAAAAGADVGGSRCVPHGIPGRLEPRRGGWPPADA